MHGNESIPVTTMPFCTYFSSSSLLSSSSLPHSSTPPSWAYTTHFRPTTSSTWFWNTWVVSYMLPLPRCCGHSVLVFLPLPWESIWFLARRIEIHTLWMHVYCCTCVSPLEEQVWNAENCGKCIPWIFCNFLLPRS